MADIRIHGIPDDVHGVLQRRARDSGQPLQQYVRAVIVAEVRRPSMADLLAQAKENARRFGGSYGFGEVVEDLRRVREDARWAAARDIAQEITDEIGVTAEDLAEAEKILGLCRDGWHECSSATS